MNRPIDITAEQVEARINAALNKLRAGIDQLLETQAELLAAAKEICDAHGEQELHPAIRRLKAVVEKVEALP